MTYHVSPVDDVIAHDHATLDCVCGPDVEWSHPDTGQPYDAPLVIHHALDTH